MNTAAAAALPIDPHAALAPSGQPWGWGVRTVNAQRRAHGGFQWPAEAGSIVVAPDWSPAPHCGGGLHVNPFGMGDWSLLSRDSDAIWQIVRYDPALAVDLDGGELGGKIKLPWVILHRDASARQLASIMAELAQRRTEHIFETLKKPETPTTGYAAHAATTGYAAHAATTGDDAHAATTGGRAHAATTGDDAHAATTGYAAHAATTGGRAHAATTGGRAHAATTGYAAHAATTGDDAHAATTGDDAHAATTGDDAIAASLGINGRAKAGPGGAIVIAEYAWDADARKYKVAHVFASKVGENGIAPSVWYELRGGAPVAVES